MVVWNVVSEFNLSKEDAQLGMTKAIKAAQAHLKDNPDEDVILQFEAGTYLFKEDQVPIELGKNKLDYSGSFIFEGAGMRETIFVVENPCVNVIVGKEWKNLQFKGIHFTRNYLTVSQGVITEVGDNNVAVKLHEGFPNPIEFTKLRTPIFPTQGKFLKKYRIDEETGRPILVKNNNRQIAWDMYKSTYDEENRIVNFSIRGKIKDLSHFKVGDLVGIKCKHGGSNVFKFHAVKNLVFEDCLWTQKTRGVIRGGSDGIRFSGCRIERAPPVCGQIPFMCSPDGGPQIGQPNDDVVTNVVIENCYFEGSGDDNFAIFNGVKPVVRNNISHGSFARTMLIRKCSGVVLENNKITNGVVIIDDDRRAKKSLACVTDECETRMFCDSVKQPEEDEDGDSEPYEDEEEEEEEE